MIHQAKVKTLSLAALPLLMLLGVEFRDDGQIRPAFGQAAHAVIGVPVSPMSVGGVARRSTRRAVAYTSTASASAAASSAAAADAAAAEAAAAEAEAANAAAQAAQPAAAALPTGTVVSALPSGCTSTVIDGGSYFNCAGTIYKPTFKSNNLVYVVQ